MPNFVNPVEYPFLSNNKVLCRELSQLLDLALVLYERSKELLCTLQAMIPQDNNNEANRDCA